MVLLPVDELRARILGDVRQGQSLAGVVLHLGHRVDAVLLRRGVDRYPVSLTVAFQPLAGSRTVASVRSRVIHQYPLMNCV